MKWQPCMLDRRTTRQTNRPTDRMQ